MVILTEDPVEVILNYISDQLKTNYEEAVDYSYNTYTFDPDYSLPNLYVMLNAFDDTSHVLTPNIKVVTYNVAIGFASKDKREAHKFEEMIRKIIGDTTRDPSAEFYTTSNIYEMVLNGGSHTEIIAAGSVIYNRELELEVKKQYVMY